MTDKLIKKCQEVADNIRRDVIEMTHAAGKNAAHIGGCLSMPEILAVLYFGVMKININNMKSEYRDRFILSKGHGAMALYSALKEIGLIKKEDLLKFKNTGSEYWTHPTKNLNIGIEFSSGSLGQGLSLGAGTAFALKLKNNPHRVYVYLGDGECQEGSVWEAAAFIAQHNLNNITIIIDNNKIQLDSFTKNIINMDNIADQWKSFGFDVKEVDGHNVEALLNVFNYKSNKPIAIIANTVKGKGVSFIENNPVWHTGILTEEQYKAAIAEQEEKNG